MSQLFGDYAHIIIFLHVFGAFVWVGGMIAVRVAVHPSLQEIEDIPTKLGTTLKITGRLFNLVMPFIGIILITALIMAIALDGHHNSLKGIFISKEIIWSIMTLNYIYMYISRAKAYRAFLDGDFKRAKSLVKYIPNILLPVNIALGTIALWLGISLRGY